MLRVKIKTIGEGQHPSEAVVAVTTSDGKREELIVDKRSIERDTLRVGYPIRDEGKRLLIELPRETLSGSWRVWVNREALKEGA